MGAAAGNRQLTCQQMLMLCSKLFLLTYGALTLMLTLFLLLMYMPSPSPSPSPFTIKSQPPSPLPVMLTYVPGACFDQIDVLYAVLDEMRIRALDMDMDASSSSSPSPPFITGSDIELAMHQLLRTYNCLYMTKDNTFPCNQ